MHNDTAITNTKVFFLLPAVQAMPGFPNHSFMFHSWHKNMSTGCAVKTAIVALAGVARGLSAVLRTKELLVLFPVGVQARSPVGGAREAATH